MSARTSKSLVFCLAILFAGEGVVGLAHRAQRHVRCPEHGELMDVGARAAGEALFRLAESTTAGSSADVRGAPRSQSGEHEHCSILAMSRERVAPAGSAPAIAAAAWVTVSVAPTIEGLRAARPLYRVAPKTSPPA